MYLYHENRHKAWIEICRLKNSVDWPKKAMWLLWWSFNIVSQMGDVG